MGEEDGEVSACTVQLETLFCFFLIFTQSVVYLYSDFHTTLHFVNKGTIEHYQCDGVPVARTSYFCSLNVIVSLPIVQGRSGLSICM
jgi:hypothetical protein